MFAERSRLGMYSGDSKFEEENRGGKLRFGDVGLLSEGPGGDYFLIRILRNLKGSAGGS